MYPKTLPTGLKVLEAVTKKNKTNVDAANSSTYERHGGVVQMTNA
jgi:hypothetical protein